MSIAREELFKIEHGVFQCRLDAGTQFIRSWLIEQQARVNRDWPQLAGDDLIRLQGEARMLAKLVKLIEQGPSHKQPQGGTNG